MPKKLFFIFVLIYVMLLAPGEHVNAQFFQHEETYTRQDTLRGSVTPERAWWDLTFYHLDVNVHPEDSTISGTNLVRYEVLEAYDIIQIDLQEPMFIKEVSQDGTILEFEREGAVYFISLKKEQQPGTVNELLIEFDGQPVIAANPPWDGGLTWTKDSNGNPFIANSNQGIGASVWWPNKDHPEDEPDSMLISVTVPDSLMDVSNGRLRSVDENEDGTKTWRWFVSNPINNYGVNINIGDYVHFGETYEGEKGRLDMDYYVLRDNLEKAKIHFEDARLTMEAFEYWFGPYPFYEDSYKLVEAPYLGMEHQSSVTYGNKYMKGYLGRDLSGTGWGMEFDYIIVHETGHEWFANNITYVDKAYMWIHESFTFYSEGLFLDYHFGEQAGAEYLKGARFSIRNEKPVSGTPGLNKTGSSDVYNKGGNMLHTLRQVFNDDSLWRATLRGLNEEFYHQTVTTEEVEGFFSEAYGRDLTPFFDQYLRDIRIPILEYTFRNGFLFYRWNNTVAGFDMPVKVMIDEQEQWLEPLSRWQRMPSEGTAVVPDSDFYIGVSDMMGSEGSNPDQ